MTTTTYYYVRPTDSLFVRGNLAFGDAGEHGTGPMPPPPSLFAGAFRSALLGHDGAQLAAFVDSGCCTDAALARCLGTPTEPGEFAITWLSLAGEATTDAQPAPLLALPADLLRLGQDFAGLQPQPLPPGVQSSGELPLRATLRSAKQAKPTSGIYLNVRGLSQHLGGQRPDQGHGIEAKHLYQRDPRLGIGLNTDSRTAEEGHLYTTEGYAFSPKADPQRQFVPAFASTGFLVGIRGVDGLLPESGVLRLGGDGRSALYRRVAFTPPAAPAEVLGNQRFRLILQTPAIFAQGWLPDGVVQQNDSSYRLLGEGYSAVLRCAALGRRDIVSGWDLVHWKPKPAQAAVPAGSVYWFDQFEGEASQLAAWVRQGLWPDPLDALQQARRAEGYNCALLGAWN